LALAGWIIGRPVNQVLGILFRGFHSAFQTTTSLYTFGVAKLLRFSALTLVAYAGLVAATYWGLTTTPRGFIPSQDMGYLFATVQLPDSASIERTERVMRQIADITRKTPGIRHTTYISGQSFALGAAGSNFGTMFMGLDDYSKRRTPDLSASSIAADLNRRLSPQIFDGMFMVL